MTHDQKLKGQLCCDYLKKLDYFSESTRIYSLECFCPSQAYWHDRCWASGHCCLAKFSFLGKSWLICSLLNIYFRLLKLLITAILLIISSSVFVTLRPFITHSWLLSPHNLYIFPQDVVWNCLRTNITFSRNFFSPLTVLFSQQQLTFVAF